MEKFLGAQRLRNERTRLGIGQGDAALLAGVSRNMWGAYERGLSSPGADVLMRLVGHGIDLNYVLGGSRTITTGTLSEPEEALFTDYRDTDDEGRAAITRTARMEAQRVRHTPPPPGGNYPASPGTSTAVLLHETKAQPKPVKRKAPPKD